MKIGQVYERMSEANMPLREFRRGHAEGKSAYKKAVDDGASSSFIAGIQKGEYTERGIGYFLPKKGAPITPELKGRLCGYAMGMLEDTAQTGRGSYARINAALDLLNRTGNLTTSNRVGRLVNDWSKIYESDPETFNNLISHIGKLIGADKE